MESVLKGPIACRIDRFDFFEAVVPVPGNTVWYRAYDPTLPILGSEPLFFGDIEVANMYAMGNPNRRLGEFHTTRPLQLMDIRYAMMLMRM